MDTKLFVGNLEWSVNGDTLRTFFEQAGTVKEATIVLDRETGRSRGFGFVTMETLEGAQKAIHTLDGIHLNSRPLMVSQAKPEGSRNENNELGIVADFIKFKARPGEELGFNVGQKHFTIRAD